MRLPGARYLTIHSVAMDMRKDDLIIALEQHLHSNASSLQSYPELKDYWNRVASPLKKEAEAVTSLFKDSPSKSAVRRAKSPARAKSPVRRALSEIEYVDRTYSPDAILNNLLDPPPIQSAPSSRKHPPPSARPPNHLKTPSRTSRTCLMFPFQHPPPRSPTSSNAAQASLRKTRKIGGTRPASPRPSSTHARRCRQSLAFSSSSSCSKHMVCSKSQYRGDMHSACPRLDRSQPTQHASPFQTSSSC
jgi:hypothetical protein